MKITAEHYATLKTMIDSADQSYPSIRESFENGEISAKRFRWDLSYVSGATRWICDNLYSYLNDDHIDTALRKITKSK